MNKEMNIIRFKDDGRITVPYVGINKVDPSEYEYMTAKQFIEAVEATDLWDDIDSEVFEQALAEYDLDFSSYDDPDDMWEDFVNAVEGK